MDCVFRRGSIKNLYLYLEALFFSNLLFVVILFGLVEILAPSISENKTGIMPRKLIYTIYK